MDHIALTMERQELGDVVPKDNNHIRKILSQLDQDLQEFEEMFEQRSETPWLCGNSQSEADLPQSTWSTCGTQTETWSTCGTQTETWSTCGTQTESWSTCGTQTETWSTCGTQTETWSTCEGQTQTETWSTCEGQTQTETWSNCGTQTETWSTCGTQTETWSTCGTQTETWSTCEGQTQTETWSTCEGQTQTEDHKDLHVKEAELKAELELAREKLASILSIRRHESERQEACETLRELQLLHEKVCTEHFEELKSVNQCLEQQVSVCKSLEKQKSENAIQREKIETLERQLQDFEELKEKYSWSVNQNQSLEREFKEHQEELKMVNQCLEEQVSVCKTLEEQMKENSIQNKRIEILEHQLQEFEALKEEFSWSVKQNQSLEKELERTKEISCKHEPERKEACEINETANQCKKIEMLERQLQEFEQIKEEYSWSVRQNQSLGRELEQAKETSRKHEAELQEACEKLVGLKLSQKKVLEEYLEGLRVFKKMFKEQDEVRKQLEQQISEKDLQEKPCMCQTVASTETLTDLQDVREENSTSNVQTIRTFLEEPQTSADGPRPQSWKDDCTKRNVKNLTQLFEGKPKQDKQQQVSELKRNQVKGKNVAALMKRFEQ
uniref:Uncharacterized protein n=1 Tax=Knipowitschia caucasica TaxID=637954 RepID=A0AAV2LVV5_KNICA